MYKMATFSILTEIMILAFTTMTFLTVSTIIIFYCLALQFSDNFKSIGNSLLTNSYNGNCKCSYNIKYMIIK